MVNKKPALGRGLSALLENANTDITTRLTPDGEQKVTGSIAEITIASIEANPFQPRSLFEEESLLELAESIKTHGIIQPVTVRKMGYDKFQLISGERRFRASQIAGLTKIPAYIRVANDQTMLEMALVENIQRENLDAIEIAISFKRLIQECNLTQEALSDKVAKKRSTVTNYLRLLKLPPEIQVAIRKNIISMGHARAILSVDGIDGQLELFDRVLKDGLSVRKTEDLAHFFQGTEKKTEKKDPTNFLMPQHEIEKKYLSQIFDSKVELKRDRSGKGKIIINFLSDNDLERILNTLKSK